MASQPELGASQSGAPGGRGMKRAFLVYGPESSGNRLMTRVLVACGCYGDGSHHQRLNDRPPPRDADKIVWFRSVPYAHAWPNLTGHIDQVLRYEYQPTILVMNRDVYAIARSQVRTGHVRDIAAAYRSITTAYRIIFDAINQMNANYLMVSYESLFIRQPDYLGWLLAHIGLTLESPIEEITDQNAKHYGGANADT